METAREVGGTPVGISGVQQMGPMTRRVDVAIIDDDPVLVALLQHAMESRSMRVAAYGDGETAVAALSGVYDVEDAVLRADATRLAGELLEAGLLEMEPSA